MLMARAVNGGVSLATNQNATLGGVSLAMYMQSYVPFQQRGDFHFVGNDYDCALQYCGVYFQIIFLLENKYT